ncbi:glycosyltransferase family 2 protein [Cohnella terricola]|uniref:Glycosyltransferase family 2 protein n=1 Tax=Cohnella terricola TaxID=1289167 RepID=A0A559JB12_9BACL|nr:glycosyltransferase family 2 protein [Cohnella terricola]TVX97065.1 glycosyltransferase family 2 protein [Cohnella terricola]
MNNKKFISFVVPVFNEEENVFPLYEAVKYQMNQLPLYDYEILFTDNHSTDSTFALLEGLARNDKRIRVIRFSRNFGYQKSIYTGYLNAIGDAAIQLDCDLQDPIELVPVFLEHWENGNEVVYGERRSRKEGFLINTTRKVFYRIVDKLSEDHIPRDAGDFRLVDRKILDQLKEYKDEQPYLRGAIAAMGFNQIGVPYDRNERTRGQSKFKFNQLIRLAFDGILNHSLVPLRLATYTGLIVSAITFLALLVYLVGKFMGANWPAGFATTTILILLSLSLNALFLGIIGEYLGRIYQQVKKKPMTIIERQINSPVQEARNGKKGIPVSSY